MEFLGPVLEIILSCWGPISQRIGYLKNLNDKIRTLERETKELKYIHEEVQANVEDAVSVGKSRVPRVEDWLKDAGEFVAEVGSIRSEFEQRQTCFMACCTDYVSRYRLGKKVVEKTEYAKELKGKGVFDKVAVSPSRPRVLQQLISLPGEKQNTFEQTVEEMWRCLYDDENAIICLYGIGGIGKTTLMKAINNRFIGTKDFSVVIWVTVSKDLNLESIQENIGRQLKIDFKSNEDKRGKLLERLKNIRYVLILDDLWKAFSLDDVGIPKPDKQNRCKIAITTRSIEVCNDMGANKKIKVSTLTDEEAWSLFNHKAGSVVLRPEIQPLAEKVVKECGGLPLAIKVVGRAMKEKKRKELWENALRALKASTVSEVRGMDREVFHSLKHSYDCLEDPKLQSCFLYCSLFPEDYEISTKELVRYWAFEEELLDNTNTLQEAFNKGYEIIERLKDSCLLEEEVKESCQHVRMHDLIRDLAIWITSSSSSSSIQATKFLVKAGEGLEYPPDEKMWRGVGRISLMENRIENLQIKPSCPILVTLLLRNNVYLDCINDSFYQFMPLLRILDISYTGIKSLPASLSMLANLRALICRKCYRLEEIPPLGQLKDLQLLDLSHCRIKSLPGGIAVLVKLWQLYLDRGNLATFPCNLITRLTCLEDLTLSGYDECGIATLREAATLPRLTTFRICLSSFDGFTADDMYHKFWAGLRRFEVTVGDATLSCHKTHHEPYDKIIRIFGLESLPLGIELLTIHAERLKMVGCRGAALLAQVIRHSSSLRQISVYKFHGLECIVDWREVGGDAFDCLEVLCLHCLPDLKMVFDVREALLPPTCFQQLKMLFIEKCHELKFAFSSSMVKRLHKLQALFVFKCKGMEEVIEGDEVSENAFPSLRILILSDLPKLKSICSQRLVFTSMEWIIVGDCPELKNLPILCSGVQGIRGGIVGRREWWEGIEWEDEHSKHIYSSLHSGEYDDDEDELGRTIAEEFGHYMFDGETESESEAESGSEAESLQSEPEEEV